MALLSKTSPEFRNFFIYNSTFGPKEGMEKEKILLYLPPEEDIEKQIRNVGLCEAIVKFTQQFTPDKPCESLHTQKTRQVFYEPETDFWMIMTVTIPFSEKMADSNQAERHYHHEDVHDNVLIAVLKQTYQMFKLFNGSFRDINAFCDLNELRRRLGYFFARYLGTIDFSKVDILSVFSGIQFLPLDKTTFLKISCFMNLIEHKFSSIKYTVFMYDDQIVWSGLEQEDMRVLYRYLTTSLIPVANEEWAAYEKQMIARGENTSSRNHRGRFVTCPPDLMEDVRGPPRKLPRIFIEEEDGLKEFFLVVYQAVDAVVSMLVAVNEPPDKEICKQLSGFVGHRLTNLANVISEHVKTKKANLTVEQEYRYVYFNHMNLAQKTTIHNKKQNSTFVPPEIIKIICNINADFARANDDGEVYMKTLTDCWVVGRKSDQRELYVIINQKNANLIDVNEEVKRMTAMHFNQIFFLD
ncbi:vacuolar fusion protein CCZ1 homolog [Xenia sp. Carnegie-2017]|uniref:vacuolar fusion protein CCZ1 homolog n=1 Tax=Xenia sp. Carnegie-2017 TaxID=2897299 RepID=UPI001F043380|nr:vacuolar fusion protein CCZ1 homolog [Xenia sp. Carnegie-2017]